jgi:hypothetical protein
MVEENKLREWLKRDFVYIVLVLFALLACLLTLANVGEYQQQCNEHWQTQIEKNNMFGEYKEFNQSFDFKFLPVGDLDENKD